MSTVIKLNSDIFPTKTLAAILVEQHQALVVDEITLPDYLDVGQVLVEFAYSGICGSQLGEIDGVKGPDRYLPHLLGHEGSGRVIAVGPGVTSVAPGDTVVAHWRKSVGIDAAVPSYRWREKKVNAGQITTFNRHAVISEDRLTGVPADTNLKTAALFGCAVTTGFGLIDNVSGLRLGEEVVVFGSGGVGLNIIQAAHLAGATRIVAVDLFDNRLEMAAQCGATNILNARKVDAWERLENLFAVKPPDVFVDNTGKPEIVERGYDLVGTQGRVLLVGVPHAKSRAKLFTLPLHFGKRVIGTHGGEVIPNDDIPRYMALCTARKVDLEGLITKVASLAAINELINGMRDGSISGRCMVDLFSSETQL